MADERAYLRLQRLGNQLRQPSSPHYPHDACDFQLIRRSCAASSAGEQLGQQPAASSSSNSSDEDNGDAEMSPQTVEELRRRYARPDIPENTPESTSDTTDFSKSSAGIPQPPRFRLQGVNHLALVSSDMRRTCRFYGGVLGLRLVKTLELPGGGQHFFFDTGRGSLLAFFWWPELKPGVSGVTRVSPQRLLRSGGSDFRTAVGTMNHVAWNVDYAALHGYRRHLARVGVLVSPVLHHTDDPGAPTPGFAASRDAPGVYMSSIYFWGPDGEYLELIAQHNDFRPEHDVAHLPAGAAEIEKFAFHPRPRNTKGAADNDTGSDDDDDEED